MHLGQKWLIQNRESPAHSSIQNYFDGNFSLACTYHRDSDVPCYYGFYIAFGNLTTLKSDRSKYFIPSKLSRQLELHSSVPFSNFNSSFLMGYKNKLILWIYSNCKVKYRMDYAKQLLKSGIEIDIYGKCGKTDPCKRNQECLISMYKKYKFYLAFENSQCYDYITEKVWKSLYYGMVPIVYGAPLESYFYHLPPNSYIHVKNFSSARQLVKYIMYLDKNNDVYLRYHAWRSTYSAIYYDLPNIEICTICKSLFDNKKSKIWQKSQWWTYESQCN